MNEINGVIPAHLLAEPAIEAKPKNVMGKDDFMKLLMAQLKQQDPLNPMDHKEFATNLAQFGSLEQLTNIGKGIENLKTGQNDDSKFGLLAYIGRKIQANGNEVNMVEGQPVMLNYKQKEGVTPIKAAIFDSFGHGVRELNFTSKDDLTRLVWDGKNDEGAAVPGGKYEFRIVGVDNKGQGQELTSEVNGKVTGVDMAGGAPVLLVQTDSGQIRLEPSKVRNVTMETPAATSIPMHGPNIAMAPQSQSVPIAAKPDLSALMKAAQAAEGEDAEEVTVPPEVAEAVEAMAAQSEDEPETFKSFPNIGGLNR